MFREAVRNLVACLGLLAFCVYGGTIVFAQGESSAFYSNYDARELVKNKKYKGIEFTTDEMGAEFTVSEFLGRVSEKSKSISYQGRIQTFGEHAFKVEDFLKWLAAETINQIESGQGRVVRQRHRVGKRFYLEYTQAGFAGRIEVDGDLIDKDQISLDVEIIETNEK